jgi:capping protein beta
LYYGKSSLGSVHLWDTDSTGFAGCFLLYNTSTEDDADNDDNNDIVSRWSSIHILEASKSKEKWLYSLESTIYISITRHPGTTISGSLAKQRQREVRATSNDEVHISNIGKFIEDIEDEMRSELEGLYIQKTSVDYIMDWGGGTKGEGQEMSELRKDLNEAVLARGLDGSLKLS